jgi:hypothetical protein
VAMGTWPLPIVGRLTKGNPPRAAAFQSGQIAGGAPVSQIYALGAGTVHVPMRFPGVDIGKWNKIFEIKPHTTLRAHATRHQGLCSAHPGVRRPVDRE